MTVLTLQKIAGDVVIRGMGKLTPRIDVSYNYYREKGGLEFTDEAHQCYVDIGFEEPYENCERYNSLPKSIKFMIRDQLNDYRGMFDFINKKYKSLDVFYDYVIGGYLQNTSLVLKYFPELLTHKPPDRYGPCVPLIKSVISGDYYMSKLLLEHGADVNAKDSLERAAIVYAVEYKQGRILRLLLEYGADVNTTHPYTGKTLLYICIEKHYSTLAKILLGFGADASRKDNTGCTPILLATYIGWYDMVSLLLEHGVKDESTDWHSGSGVVSMTCKRLAWLKEFTEIYELLEKYN